MRVHATTNSVQICTDSTMAGHEAQDCINALKWDVPKPTDLILTRPPESSEQWGATTTWKLASSVLPPTQYRVCPLDLTLPAVHGGVNGVYVGDPCGQSQIWQTSPNGQSVLLTCTAPTKNTDTTDIGSAQLPLKFYFWEGLTSGATTGIYRQISPPQSACTYTFPNLELGPHFFVAAVVDERGAQSASSGEATKTILPPGTPNPNPPTNLVAGSTVGTQIAYIPAITQNQMTVLEVGTVPGGVACDSTQYIKTKTAPPRPIDQSVLFLVPVASVAFLSSVTDRQIAVYAKCSGS
jgi:hypothetical protein